MKALIVGDIHIDKGISIGKNQGPNKLNSRNEDKFKLLNWVQKKCKEYDVKNVIFTGDIFEDANISPHLVDLFFSHILSYDKLGIFCHIILGNHDIKRIGAEYYSFLNLLNTFNVKNCKVYKDISTIEIEDGLVTFIPFRDRKSLECQTTNDALIKLKSLLPKKSDKKHICVGHLTLSGSLYVGDEIDDLHNELHCPIDFFSEVFDATFMGHIHKPQVLNKNPLVCHVGSLDISDFGEINHEKIICLYDSSKEHVVNIPVPTRNLRKIDVCVPSSVDPTSYLLDVISQEESNNSMFDSILKIEIKFEDPNHKINIQEINEKIEKLSVHNLVGIIESRVSSAVSTDKKNTLSVSVEPVTAFIDWLSAQPISEDRYSSILDIAKSIIEEASK